MMLALSPGGLLALQFARVSKGNRVYAVALVIALSLLAIFFTPLLAHWFFPRQEEGKLFAWLVVLFVLIVALPLFAGRELQKLFPEIAPKVGPLVGPIVDPDLHRRGAAERQVQNARDQSHWH